jgi:hypothetical protein
MRYLLWLICFVFACDAKSNEPGKPLPESPISPADITVWQKGRLLAKEAKANGRAFVADPKLLDLIQRVHKLQSSLKPSQLLVHGRVTNEDDGKTLAQAQIYEVLDKGNATRAKLVTVYHPLPASGSFLLLSEGTQFGADLNDYDGGGPFDFPEINCDHFKTPQVILGEFSEDNKMKPWDDFVKGVNLELFRIDQRVNLDSRLNDLKFNAKSGIPDNCFYYDRKDRKRKYLNHYADLNCGLQPLPIKTDKIFLDHKHLPADVVRKLREKNIDVEKLVERKALAIFCEVENEKIKISRHSFYKGMPEVPDREAQAEILRAWYIDHKIGEKFTFGMYPGEDYFPAQLRIIAFGVDDGFIEKREYQRGRGAPHMGYQMPWAPEKGYKNVLSLDADELAISMGQLGADLHFYLHLNGKYGRGTIKGGLRGDREDIGDVRGLPKDRSSYVLQLPIWIQPDGTRKLRTPDGYGY